LEPTRALALDGIQLTKAVKKIGKLIDKRQCIIKEDIGDEYGIDEEVTRHLPLHWVCAHNCPLQVVQLVYEKCAEAIKIESDDGHLPLHCLISTMIHLVPDFSGKI
jgi:hypothetical protein